MWRSKVELAVVLPLVYFELLQEVLADIPQQVLVDVIILVPNRAIFSYDIICENVHFEFWGILDKGASWRESLAITSDVLETAVCVVGLNFSHILLLSFAVEGILFVNGWGLLQLGLLLPAKCIIGFSENISIRIIDRGNLVDSARILHGILPNILWYYVPVVGKSEEWLGWYLNVQPLSIL